MSSFIKLIFISLTTFFLITCTSKDNVDEFINVEEEFVISLSEALEKSPRRLVVEVSSFEGYDCLNYELSCSASFSNTSNTIVLEDIISPINCEEGLHFPSCTHVFPILALGQNEINIGIKDNFINNGIITKEEGRYRLSLLSQHGIFEYTPTLNIIPEKMIWGKINPHDESFDIESIYNSITNELIPSSIKDGFYGHFRIQNNSLILSKDLESEKGRTYFLEYKDEANLEEFITFINKLRSEQSEEISISIFTSSGLEL